MLVNLSFQIKKELSIIDDPAKKIEYLNSIIQFCDRQRHIISSKHSIDMAEVIETQDTTTETGCDNINEE